MPKITKTKKKYNLQKLYPETNIKLQKLSKKSGLYIIELVANLVDREYVTIFDKLR